VTRERRPDQVADLQARRNHCEFEKRVQQTVFVVGGTGKNDCEGESAGGNKNPTLEKPSEDCPKQHAPDCKGSHASASIALLTMPQQLEFVA
jgi:hypothetical protein